MTFAGLTLQQMLTLFGALGGAMVLLYVLKLRRRRVEIPYSPLWERVVEERQSTSLFKALERLLSLLLQLTMLALIVAALGDPELTPGGGLAGCAYQAPEPPPERHTLLMIDASASMATVERGETRLERARAEAREVIEQLADNPNHRAMVVQLDGRVRPLTLWTTDRAELRAAIEAMAPTGALDTPTAVDAGLAFARMALRGRADGKLLLVTDRAFDPIPGEVADPLGLEVIGVGSAGVNVGLQAFNVRPYLDDSLTYAIFYAVRNESERDLRATLFLYANEAGRSVDDFVDGSRVVASYPLTLPAGAVTEAVIDGVSFEGSRLAARVVIADDEPARDVFPRDDVAFALVPERRKLKVQLVTEGNLFLHATLFVRENVDFEVVAPAEYRGPEGHDVTVVDGAGVDVSRPGAYFLLNPPLGGPFEVTGELAAPEVGKVDKRHPIARNLAFADLAVAAARKIAPARRDELVVRDTRGNPLLLARRDVEGQRSLVALAFDVRQSLMPLSYGFPLLMVNVLGWFHPEQGGLLKPNRAGTELALPDFSGPQGRAGATPDGGTGDAEARLAAAAEGAEGAEIIVRGPDGEPPVEARRIAGRIRFSADRLGIYELLQADSEGSAAGAAARDINGAAPRSAVAINLMSPQESQVTPRGEYRPWVAPVVIERERDPWLEHLWRTLLLVALGLILLEWFSWHRRITV